MTPTVELQELAIVVAVRNHNPAILTLDFLKYSGIVPPDWELARTPISSNRLAEVVFTSGVGIIAEPNRVIFMEAIQGKAMASLAVLPIARRYVETLPNLEYLAVGINPIGKVPFDTQPDAARSYVASTLLSKGPWQEIGTAPVRTTVNYTYTLEQTQFNLSVSDAILQLPDSSTLPVVLFNGHFNHNLHGNSSSSRLQEIVQILSDWLTDIETYKEIVNTKFLGQVAETKIEIIPDSQSAIPDIFAMNTKKFLTANSHKKVD